MTKELTPAQKENLFKPGQSGNPAGRPKGARSKLSEKFLQDIHEDWKEHGVEVLEKVRKKDPEVYLRVVAGLIPKELTQRKEGDSLTEFLQFLQRRQRDEDNRRAKQLIEGEVLDVEEEPPKLRAGHDVYSTGTEGRDPPGEVAGRNTESPDNREMDND